MIRIFTNFLLYYLKVTAKLQIKKYHPQNIIGVTGSAGKSSTREAINSVISTEFLTLHCSHGNSETGIPLDILDIRVGNYKPIDWIRIVLTIPLRLLFNWKKYSVILLEMGIDNPKPPKNMEYLLSIIKPNIAIFTNVSGVHGQNYDLLIDSKIQGDKRIELIKDQISIEKGKLITNLPQDGIAILNKDDPRVWKFNNQCPQWISVGKNNSQSLNFIDHSFDLTTGSKFTYQFNNQDFELKFPDFLLTESYGYTLGFAIATGIALKLEPEICFANLQSNFKLPPSRMSIFPAINNSYVIDSTYNASENSMLDALNMLKNIKYSGPKIAILGDLRELGVTSKAVHQKIWQLAQKSADKVITIGPEFNSINSQGLITANQFWDSLTDLIPNNSLILVKGSQNTIFLETIVERLLQDSTEKYKLCRQSKFWQTTKSKFFAKHFQSH